MKAINRWGDILQGHFEIYPWLACTKGLKLDTYVKKLRRTFGIIRSIYGSPSDQKVLDKTALLLDYNAVGLQFIRLGRGRLLLNEKGFGVAWDTTSTIPDEELTEWDDCFQYLMESLLYVVH